MRCPHCRGEIPQGSQFCGVCGHNVTTSPTGGRASYGGSHDSGAPPPLSPSLFELPVSPGARRARVAMLLTLNLLLAGGGIALFNGYLHKRYQARQGAGFLLGKSEPTPSPLVPAKAVHGGVSEGAFSNGQGAIDVDAEQRSWTAGKTRTSDDAHDTHAPPRPVPQPGPTARPHSIDAGLGPLPSRVRIDAAPTRRLHKPGASGSPTSGADPDPVEEPGEPPSEASDSERVQVIAAKISLVVSRHQGQLTRCYQNAGKTTNPNQPLEGRIHLQFSIHLDGKARSIGVVSDDTGSPVLARCLVGLVGSWTFPSSGGDALDFVWPFDFQAPQ